MAIQFFNIKNIDEIDFGKLLAQLPFRSAWNPFSTQGRYIMAILQSQDMLRQHGIDSALRLAHFFGQGIVETNFLRAKAENLNYSFAVLKKLFGHKFVDDEEIKAYAGKPQKIANRIYANRMGNGPEESGDGWRYRGRGFFQLTGKDNYKKFGDMAGLDLVSDPEILERDFKTSLQVAAAYFQKAGLAEFADRNDVAAVSRGVNRGNPRATKPAYHEAERIEWTTKALALVRDPNAILGGAGAPATGDAAQGPLRLGATGPAVEKVQALLNRLGYAVGEVDGIFGPGTRRAVLAFQDEHGLKVTGEVDGETQTAMEKALDEQPVVPKEAPTPKAQAPRLPPSDGTRQPKPPLAKSRTIWGVIVAALAGIAAQIGQIFSAFPAIQTPWGAFSSAWLLAALLLAALGFVVYAHIDERAKKGV